MQRREEQQLLPRQRRKLTAIVPRAEPEVERMLALPDLHLLAPRAQHRGDVASVSARHDLAHRASAGQKRIEIAVEKRVEADLSSSGADGSQELRKRSLRRLVRTLYAHPAGKPHQLADRRIHHRHRLAYGAVQRRVSAAERHIASQRPERCAAALAHLHGGLTAACSALSFEPSHCKKVLPSAAERHKKN